MSPPIVYRRFVSLQRRRFERAEEAHCIPGGKKRGDRKAPHNDGSYPNGIGQIILLFCSAPCSMQNDCCTLVQSCYALPTSRTCQRLYRDRPGVFRRPGWRTARRYFKRRKQPLPTRGRTPLQNVLLTGGGGKELCTSDGRSISVPGRNVKKKGKQHPSSVQNFAGTENFVFPAYEIRFLVFSFVP